LAPLSISSETKFFPKYRFPPMTRAFMIASSSGKR
jgi:hypothetical protein